MNCEIPRICFYSNRLKESRFEDWYNSITNDFGFQNPIFVCDFREGCVKMMKWERWFRDFCERNGDGMVGYELNHDYDGFIVIHRVKRKQLGCVPEKGFR